MKHILIANRGEISIRIARAACDLGLKSTAIYSEDDDRSLHTKTADGCYALIGKGAAAYLDIEQVILAAKASGCDAVHPGYGFLSENAAFARRCGEESIRFIGPRAEMLELFGDKIRARAFAEKAGVPLLLGTRDATSLDEARAFFAELGRGGAMMIKAIMGGGGRGMRVVRHADGVADAYARCQSEALSAFGDGAVYVERLIERARHIEIQIIGDGTDVSHVWERDCTLQRRNQKIVEIAPSPTLSESARKQIIDAAVSLASLAKYDSLGTFEFLVDADAPADYPIFAFMEANPRVQVEHTVTEAITGIDLVQSQIQIAAGRTLGDLRLTQAQIPSPRGYAIQLRVNMETPQPDGSAKPAGGTLSIFETSSGPGVRVDTFGYAGYTSVPRFDSLLAKLIVYSPNFSYEGVAQRTLRALKEFRIAGIATNIAFLKALLERPEFNENAFTTRFVEEHAAELIAAAALRHQERQFEAIITAEQNAEGAKGEQAPPGTVAITAPMQGTVISIDVEDGALVRPGQRIALMEAMKMEQVIAAEQGGYVRLVSVQVGDTVMEGRSLLYIEPADVEAARTSITASHDLDAVRDDLAAVFTRHAFTLDENRPEVVAKRHAQGKRTARENIADLTDDNSFLEYGALIVAAQRRRRSMDDLMRKTPADGLITGLATVNGDLFGQERARCMVISYDFTVLAGTQGMMNHKKTDRMLELCDKLELPLVLFGEGGGGRPGDTDMESVGLEISTFYTMAKLSGKVPLISIITGKCFAGNAALVGCCDIIIATKDANIGMGGPPMIEGGGLGIFKAEEVGPMSVQGRNGVVDLIVEDEIEAVEMAKRYLSYFQGPINGWACADQRQLRWLIPENRLRGYEVRNVIGAIADEGSVLELRRGFGVGIVTALVRIEGKPFGVFANNSRHLGGAIDGDAAGKAARFMQLCDAFDLPMLNLCDTPGFMVGPEVEKTAQVRRVCQLFVVGASCSVPMFTVILRKAYGLGALGIGGGGFHVPVFTVAWPTGELGGMNLEGAVRLGYKKELEEIKDPAEQKAWFERQLAAEYELGKAVNAASYLQIDAVIDPAETRRWLMRCLASAPPSERKPGKRRPFVSVW